VQAPYRAPISHIRLALGALSVITLAIVVAGSWWIWSSGPRSGPIEAQASPSYALFAVHPNGTSVDMTACVTPAQTYGQAQPDWGEDYLSGARLYLNFTAQPEEHVAALSALVPLDCAVYVRIVPVSSAIGRALQSRIEQDMGSLRAAGVPVNGVGFDPIADKVTVAVYPLTSQSRTELERRYPKEMLNIFEQLPAVPLGS
jgi:hypothetical protein